MKTVIMGIGILILLLIGSLSHAGTWFDGFLGETLDQSWKGDRENFYVADNMLNGRNAHPIQLLPLRFIEVGDDWDNYIVECRINVFMENLLVCTKGAIILRHNGNDGYVFALHVATKTVEVFRLSDGEMLLSETKPLELKNWYLVKAELNGENMSFYLDNELVGQIKDNRSLSGSVGLAVQDALAVYYDDFTVTGPNIDDHGISAVKVHDKIPIAWASLKNLVK
ncbi:TPA: hypothetical protein ENS27_00315 [bacterium]|nr:hypothetical protein [bacterium]